MIFQKKNTRAFCFFAGAVFLICFIILICFLVVCEFPFEENNDRPYEYYIDCDEGIYSRATDEYTFSLHIREGGFTGSFCYNGTTVHYHTVVEACLLLYDTETNELIGACALDKVRDMVIVRRVEHDDVKSENNLFSIIKKDFLILMPNEPVN